MEHKDDLLSSVLSAYNQRYNGQQEWSNNQEDEMPNANMKNEPPKTTPIKPLRRRKSKAPAPPNPPNGVVRNVPHASPGLERKSEYFKAPDFGEPLDVDLMIKTALSGIKAEKEFKKNGVVSLNDETRESRESEDINSGVPAVPPRRADKRSENSDMNSAVFDRTGGMNNLTNDDVMSATLPRTRKEVGSQHTIVAWERETSSDNETVDQNCLPQQNQRNNKLMDSETASIDSGLDVKPIKDKTQVKKELGSLLDKAAVNASKKIKKTKNKLKYANSIRINKTSSNATSPSRQSTASFKTNESDDDANDDSPPSESTVDCNADPVLKRGWLRKQGKIIKTWNDRWFVLRGDYAYYYKDKEETKLLGRFMIPGNRIMDVKPKGTETNKYYFEISPQNSDASRNSQNEYILCANSHAERESWKQEFNRMLWKQYGGGIFGLRLEETMQYEERLFNRSYDGRPRVPREAPIIVENCIGFIRQHGLKEEGLFRLPGQANDVKDLQDKFDTGNRPTFAESTDIHTVTSLLKSYLRQLPEPAIPFHMYSALVDAVRGVKSNNSPTPNGSPCKENESQLKAREVILDKLRILPLHNYNLLRYICRFLDEVQMHSAFNKMDISNLALMFGPNLIRPEKPEPSLLMTDSTYVQYIMAEFITHHEYYFPRRRTSSMNDDAIKTRSMQRPRQPPPPPPKTITLVSDTVTSTDGFNTMTTATSPPGTLTHPATEDSGTGSMGPTPDNTSRRQVGQLPGRVLQQKLQRGLSDNMIMEENENSPDAAFKQRSTSEVLMRPKPSHLSPPTEIARKSLYDNLGPEPSSHGGGMCFEFRGDWSSKNESPGAGNSEKSFDIQTQSSESTNLGSRTSTNAVAGSSVSEKTVNSDIDDAATPTPTKPLRPTAAAAGLKARPRKPRKPTFGVKHPSNIISDEESNTESVPISDDRIDLTSVSSRHNSQSSLFSREDGAIPEKPPRRLPSSSSNHPVPSRMRQFEPDAVSHTSSCLTSNVSQISSYDLQIQIKELQDELKKQRNEYEKRSRLLEEQFMQRFRSISMNNSPISAAGSLDVGNRNSFVSVSSIDSRLQAHDDQFGVLQKKIEALERSNREESKRHQMTQIQLKNAERGRQAAEQRNEELQKEMKNFFNTFGGMFGDAQSTKSTS